MSRNIGEVLGEAIVVDALREVLVVQAEKKRGLKIEIARLEREAPKTVEAFEAREARIKELLDELRRIGG